MPYFKNDDINILFIHIPKTGGTSLEEYFSLKYSIPLNTKSLITWNNEIDSNRNLYKNITSTLQHLTYDQIKQNNNIFMVDFNLIDIITIVRNPYERLVSDLFYHKLINIETSKEEVYEIIKDYLISTEYDNHNIPQHTFLQDEMNQPITNIKILKTENLTESMKEIGFADFNLVCNKNENTVDYYNYLNTNSLDLINKFYHLDFTLFNYNKI